jgi:hypothetical protein
LMATEMTVWVDSRGEQHNTLQKAEKGDIGHEIEQAYAAGGESDPREKADALVRNWAAIKPILKSVGS